ncbi:MULTISPECIES: hypothetical protein [unclassified Nocardioides]|uniref:hypothetical protein n=1 Tax=unclassified Nocardioides TaxID=2615069 RepID=UPI0012E3E573|nr:MULTISPECIES: hypothetical protein [unclassified Nocardioides]
MSNVSRHGVRADDGFEFACSACGVLAATLSVRGAGQTIYDGPSYRLEFLGENSGIVPAGLVELLEGRDEIDPLDVAHLHGELGAFCCVACELNYCAKCWSTWIEFDEGFYDCTRGRCPNGHEQMLDD